MRIEDMNEAEALAEYRKWDAKIAAATSWGAALAAADEFRRDAARHYRNITGRDPEENTSA